MDKAIDKLIDKKSKEKVECDDQNTIDKIPKGLNIESDFDSNYVYIEYLNGDKEKVINLRYIDELDVSEYDTSIQDDLISLREEVSKVKYESRTYGDLWKVKVDDDKMYIPLPTINNIDITVDEFLEDIDVEDFEPSDYEKLYVNRPSKGIDSIYKKTDNGIIKNIKTMYSNFNYKYDKIVEFIKSGKFDLFENYDGDVSSVRKTQETMRLSLLFIYMSILAICLILAFSAGMIKLATIVMYLSTVILSLTGLIIIKEERYYKLTSRIARIKNIPKTIFYYIIDRGYKFKLIY